MEKKQVFDYHTYSITNGHFNDGIGYNKRRTMQALCCSMHGLYHVLLKKCIKIATHQCEISKRNIIFALLALLFIMASIWS